MISRKINIAPFIYTVNYPDADLDHEYVGLIEPSNLLIRLSDTENGHERHPIKVLETLFHESLHGIDAMFCGDVMSEELIEILTTAWFAIVADNDLKLVRNPVKDVKLREVLPDSIKIAGVKYKTVVWSQNENMELSSKCNVSTCIIGVSSNCQIQYAQSSLILAIMSAVAEAFNIAYVQQELSENSLLTFSHGLYQLLRDNDWRGWINGLQ